MLLEMSTKIEAGYDSIDEAFPPIDPKVTPLGYRVLCQIRTSPKKSKGGIIFTDDVRETDQWNTQVAKIVAVGPVAFKHRDTLADWVEGAWCGVGDFVRIPKYGGDNFNATTEQDGEKVEARFIILRDLDLIAKVDDPLAVKAYI